MAREWDIRDVASAGREDALHSIITKMTGRVDISFTGGAEKIQARGVTSHLGPLTVATVRSSAGAVARTAQCTDDGHEPAVFLGLQIHGTSSVTQHGRHVSVRPGDLVIYDSSVPYTVADPTGIKQHFIRIPKGRLALPTDTLSQSLAVRLAPGHPISALTSSHFRRLAAGHAAFEGHSADAVGQPTIDLLRAVITIHVDHEKPMRDALHDTLLTRVLEHVRTNLADPGLSAAGAAAHHHISVRHLYKVLADAGISLSAWIRSHRLEACRTDLSRPGAQAETIEAIARRWGFTDMSGFSRVFKATYGMTPRDWRRQHAKRPF
jgi:AraC-like DNA-binding protein